MTWTKLGDEFLPEAMDLSDGAGFLHVKALCWSNWRLLDLMISRKDLAMFGNPTSSSLDEAIQELIDTGWWQQVDDHTFWIGCRFSEWQRDKAQVEHRRAQLALAQRRKRLHDVGDHSLCLPGGRCKGLSAVESTVDATVELSDDSGRLRDGTVTGTPKLSQDKRKEARGDISSGHWSEAVASRVTSAVMVEQGKPCDECGDWGPTWVDSRGRRLCVAGCREVVAGSQRGGG